MQTLETLDDTFYRQPRDIRLFEVELGAGDLPGFDVGRGGASSPNQVRYPRPPAGYDGYRFIGEGPDVTRIRPARRPPSAALAPRTWPTARRSMEMAGSRTTEF